MRLPKIEWKEISDDRAALETVWGWASRSGEHLGKIADYIGPQWAHYGLRVDGKLRFCVSVEERRPLGYEIHADAEPGLSPTVSRKAGIVIMNGLLAEPGSRVIAWVNAGNRPARRLASFFMKREIEQHGYIRYGISAEEWSLRNGQR